MRRGLGVVAVLVAVSLVAGVGWMAGQRVKSPQQIAFEAEPPEPALITVEVERTELAADVVIRADVGYDDPVSLSLSGTLGGRPAVRVVTSAPRRGDELVEGSAAIEISGRPVFLLAGEIPMFRDLRPKAVGPDVLQVEQALARLGHFTGEPDRVWDLDTAAAVTTWYAASGYEPNGISDEEQGRLDAARDRVETAEKGVKAGEEGVKAARDRVETAEKGVETAEKGVETAEKGVETALRQVTTATRRRADSERAVSRARARIVEAEMALAKALEGPDDLQIRQARSAVSSAEEQLEFARADVERAAENADSRILAAEADREEAARQYSIADAGWQSAQMGVHPGKGSVPTPAEMESLRLALETADLKLDEAERGIARAYIARDRQVVQGRASLREAGDRLAAAEAALAELLKPPDTSSQSRAVEDARLSLESARSDLADAGGAVTEATGRVEDAEEAVDDAREAVADARDAVDDARATVEKALEDLEEARSDLAEEQAALAKLESEVGIWIPAGELIFLERLPVRVDLLTAERGSTVSGAFMTVTGSDLAVRGSVAVRDVALVREGGPARIDDRLLTEPLEGKLRLVAERPGTRSVANDRHYLEIVADGIPNEMVGKNVKVVIPVGGTEGEVLAVPAAALSATADGSTRVEVEQADGTTRFVKVEPGLAASGLVEVTPLDGELREGEMVVVGLASDE